MLIKDTNGVYELKVDKQRRIVHEKLVGMVKVDDYKKMDNDYRTKALPYLGKGNWMKFCDLKQWMPSTSPYPDAISEHLEYLVKNDFQGGAVLVDSATLKMQINRSAKSIVDPTYFDDEKKADEWLRSQGY